MQHPNFRSVNILSYQTIHHNKCSKWLWTYQYVTILQCSKTNSAEVSNSVTVLLQIRSDFGVPKIIETDHGFTTSSRK